MVYIRDSAIISLVAPNPIIQCPPFMMVWRIWWVWMTRRRASCGGEYKGRRKR